MIFLIREYQSFFHGGFSHVFLSEEYISRYSPWELLSLIIYRGSITTGKPWIYFNPEHPLQYPLVVKHGNGHVPNYSCTVIQCYTYDCTSKPPFIGHVPTAKLDYQRIPEDSTVETSESITFGTPVSLVT